MTSIIYVGLDVHTSNFTACCYSVSDDRAFAVVQMKPDYREILEYLNRINSQHGGKCKFVCGYEAGCLGYSLYHQLTRKDVDCVILAPSTMPITPGKRLKRTSATRRRLPGVWHTTATVRYISRMKKITP